MLARLRPFWPIIALLASGALLAGAHAFEYFGYAPCHLCLKQREGHWAVVALAVLLFIVLRFRPSFDRIAAALLGVAFLVCFGLAANHFGVEQGWIPETCSGATNFDFLGDDSEPVVVPRCDEPAWMLMGISMAGYNAIISLVLALLSFGVALAPRRNANA